MVGFGGRRCVARALYPVSQKRCGSLYWGAAGGLASGSAAASPSSSVPAPSSQRLCCCHCVRSAVWTVRGFRARCCAARLSCPASKRALALGCCTRRFAARLLCPGQRKLYRSGVRGSGRCLASARAVLPPSSSVSARRVSTAPVPRVRSATARIALTVPPFRKAPRRGPRLRSPLETHHAAAWSRIRPEGRGGFDNSPCAPCRVRRLGSVTDLLLKYCEI